VTQAAELEVALAERTQQMSEAETTLKLKEMEFERRVTNLQKEHASKVATVLHQVAAVVPAGTVQEAATPGTSAVGQLYQFSIILYAISYTIHPVFFLRSNVHRAGLGLA